MTPQARKEWWRCIGRVVRTARIVCRRWWQRRGGRRGRERLDFLTFYYRPHRRIETEAAQLIQEVPHELHLCCVCRLCFGGACLRATEQHIDDLAQILLERLCVGLKAGGALKVTFRLPERLANIEEDCAECPRCLTLTVFRVARCCSASVCGGEIALHRCENCINILRDDRRSRRGRERGMHFSVQEEGTKEDEKKTHGLRAEGSTPNRTDLICKPNALEIAEQADGGLHFIRKCHECLPEILREDPLPCAIACVE